MAPVQKDRRGVAVGLLAGLVGAATSGAAAAVKAPHRRGLSEAPTLVPFAAAPFPVAPDSVVPEKNTPFFDGADAGGRFHMAPRGGKLYEHATYADNRSLVVVPPRFDPTRAAALVVFFHGNGATLSREVASRQRVPAQLEASRLNALMVAPQLAVDAQDSSPGRFYDPGFLDTYLDEAAAHLVERAHGRFEAALVRRLPLILVAYSGGYLATAFCLHNGSAARERIAGVILLDALFGEEQKFAAWIAAAHTRAFFVSAYSPASAALDGKLAADLAEAGVTISTALPPTIVPGDVVLFSSPGAVHDDFVTQAWVRDPLQALLSRVRLSEGAGR